LYKHLVYDGIINGSRGQTALLVVLLSAPSVSITGGQRYPSVEEGYGVYLPTVFSPSTSAR